MIKLEELRVGNWYYIDNPMGKGGHEQFQLWSEYLDFEAYGSPIPLTEEILLKIHAVEELDYSEWKYLLKISAANLYFRFNAGKCYSQFNDTYLGDMISCLHELQNFCHVFKKELNLKL